MSTLYEFSVRRLDGSEHTTEYKDKVLLIVIVASRCGFTPPNMQAWKRYGARIGIGVFSYSVSRAISLGRRNPAMPQKSASFAVAPTM